MCTLAVRESAPKALIGGYQHSVVPQAALNMFIHPSEKGFIPLPDQVLTVGEIPRNILLYYGDYSQLPVTSACALRYEYLFQLRPLARQSRKQTLLVLDGVPQTVQMLKVVLHQLKNSGYKLRLRAHPALPWQELQRHTHWERSEWPNVEVSTYSLQEDLLWSDTVIYWQSAVVLEAMRMGKPVIHFKSEDILSYDPLFQSDALKWSVSQNDSLVDVIISIEQMDSSTYQQQWKEANAYIERYFHPVTPLTLALFKFDALKSLH